MKSIIKQLTLLKGGRTFGIAGSRFQAHTAVASIAANFTSLRNHYASPDGDVTDLYCVDTGWYINSSFVAQAGDNRTIKRYIECPAGVFHLVTWGAASPRTITGIGGSIKSDRIISSVTGMPLIWPRSSWLGERTVNLNATVTNFPLTVLPAASTALGVLDGNDVTDKGNSGTVAATSTTNTFGSVAIVGTIMAANARSFVVVGDSIPDGTGDVSSVGAKGGSGWVARMLDKYGYPYLKITKGGQSASDIAASHASMAALINLVSFSDAIITPGVNDLRLGRTQTQVLADQQTIYSMFTGKRIYQTTITPRSDGTPDWSSLANQAAKTDGNMAALNSVNAAIRAVPANVYAVIDAADAAMSARDSDIWTAPPAATLDGTHPTSVKAAAMAAALSV